MPIGGLISAGASLLGGYLQGEAAKDAAETSAGAQLQAARIAAEESRFRPVGITTRFGTSRFTMDPKTGRLSSAGYTISPELKAYQDRLSALVGGALTQAEQAPQLYAPLGTAATGLFGLGQQYLAQSPEQVAQQYMQRQIDLLAPGRERQLAELRNQVFQTGRSGLAVGATSARPSGMAGLGATNPELEAFYNAAAQQDAALAAQAQEQGQRQLAFGTGLFGTGANLLGQMQAGQVGALSPFTSYLGGVSSLESLGLQPLELGANLGGRNVNIAGANALLQGGLGAAAAMQQANAYSPWGSALTGIGNTMQQQQMMNRLFPSAPAPVEERNIYRSNIAPPAYASPMPFSGGSADVGSGYNWAY
jgi:hypothetical protein